MELGRTDGRRTDRARVFVQMMMMAMATSAIEGFRKSGRIRIPYLQKCNFNCPFHRDSVKSKDLLLTFASKFLQQITRFKLSRGVTEGEKSISEGDPGTCSGAPWFG